jgi:hypothetical protein
VNLVEETESHVVILFLLLRLFLLGSWGSGGGISWSSSGGTSSSGSSSYATTNVGDQFLQIGRFQSLK